MPGWFEMVVPDFAVGFNPVAVLGGTAHYSFRDSTKLCVWSPSKIWQNQTVQRRGLREWSIVSHLQVQSELQYSSHEDRKARIHWRPYEWRWCWVKNAQDDPRRFGRNGENLCMFLDKFAQELGKCLQVHYGAPQSRSFADLKLLRGEIADMQLIELRRWAEYVNRLPT